MRPSHRKPHPHHPHSGDGPFPDDLWDVPPQQMGTVGHAIKVCLAAIRSLPDKRDRHHACGHVLARLIEHDNIKGLQAVLKIAIEEVNRYDVLPHD